ncbi:response regulator [Paraburkholderia sp. J76]|uniref:response regulator n=1 Tax=Paraburkholderia sp. J76 TaxID=2805439 RepID=UPI002ABD32C3|nr:response regulator [Paraburkholderia sp. J76]
MTTPHILIVDADILARAPLAAYLREWGYLVLEATDLQEAGILLTGNASPIDIVLADMGSEERSGFALATWIRDRFPGTRMVLAASIAGSVEKAARLCEDGPALSKPYDHRIVLELIQRLRAARESAPRDGSIDLQSCLSSSTFRGLPRGSNAAQQLPMCSLTGQNGLPERSMRLPQIPDGNPDTAPGESAGKRTLVPSGIGVYCIIGDVHLVS